MKLIKQLKLFFQEGSSDKVYEIDLCEAGEGFVVNFRYGRRGAALKDGTKTIFPVALPEAEKVFLSLEQEKRKKGYVAEGEAQLDLSAAPKPRSGAGTEKRKKAITKILRAAAAGEEPETWSLSRVIWRAGDLKISEAIPSIVKVADPEDGFNIYSVVYAIGRCGTANQVPFLKELQKKPLAEHILLLTQEALLELSEGPDKDALVQTVAASLPAPIKKAYLEKNHYDLEGQLREFLFNLKTASNDYLIGLYQLARQDYPIYQLFKRILEDLPIDFNYFKYIRHIFKTAEMLEDYATYGIIAKKIERTGAKYTASYWWDAEQKKQRAFSSKTKHYLTLRIERFLRKYGEVAEAGYTDLATGILLAFDDEKDFVKSHQTSSYYYTYDSATRRHTMHTKVTHYDDYAKHNAMYYILYKNSSRYEKGKTEWKCVEPYKPGDATPKEREEAYPQLWNQAPENVIRLLGLSKCHRVQEFALKVFKANPDFEKHVQTKDVILFLQSGFIAIQRLGLELARKKFDKNQPDKELILAMLDSHLEEARAQAGQWGQELKSILIGDNDFIADLFKLEKLEAHAWLRQFFMITSFERTSAEIIIAKVIAHLVSLKIENEKDEATAAQTGDSLVIIFSDHLKNISLDILKDLFRHTSPIIHALAGKILLRHDVRAENLPEDFLQILLQSNHASSRSIGIQLLGKFPEPLLLEKKEILVSFCLSPMADVRDAIKPVILKLVKAYPAFGEELVTLFVPAFLIKESYEGVHDDLLKLLSTELGGSLHIINKERALMLLQSKFRVAQQMGAILLRQVIKEDELSVSEIVKLAGNPLEEVRKYSWDLFLKYPEKIKVQKEEALRVTDSWWEDTRAFAFDYFRNSFSNTDWNIDLLVSLCDSTKEDVQEFGKEMLTKSFREEDGTEYLLKLSQHPNTTLQLFTSLYLEKYAGNNVEMVKKLKLYFITLLSQVNKGKVAKARAIDFLKKEALKNEQVAATASEIFTRISATVAISEKAACIVALREIQKKYPAIQSPIALREYSDYIKK